MTKLVYIGNIQDLHLFDGGLTINKVYDEGEQGLRGYVPGFCYIERNDSGVGYWYYRSLFKTLEEVRNEKLLKILS